MRRFLVALGIGVLIVGCSGEDEAGGGGTGGASGDGGIGGTSAGNASGGSSGRGGAGGASGGTAGNDDPFGECGSVVGCSGELCVDPENPECTTGGCLQDRRASLADFYCTKGCTGADDCQSGYVCTEVNVAGGARGFYCVRYLPMCGNAILDPEEACDDGNTTGGDGCSADCLSDETCGNGIGDPGEVCDDENTIEGDGCSADCLSDETCGNGITDEGEQCDDENTDGEDGCEPDCTITGCGNDHPTEPEACDENAAGCDDQCRIVPVDGVSTLDRYPSDAELYSTVLHAAGAGGRLFMSWLNGPLSTIPRASVVTTDAGDHWQTRRTITVDGQAGIPSESLLRGTTGNDLVVWYAYTEHRMRRSSDFGLTWGEVETHAFPNLDGATNSDMLAAGDTWYFAWSDYTNAMTYDTWLVRSDNAGSTWSEPLMVGAPSTGCRDLGLAAEEDGHLLVTTCSGAMVSADSGRTFSDVVVTSSEIGDLFGVGPEEIDARNAFHLGDGSWVFPTRGSLGIWRTTDHFATWTEREIGTTWSGTKHALRAPDGTLHWGFGGRIAQASTESVIVMRRSENDGVDWSPTVTVATFADRELITWGMAAGERGTFVWWQELEDGGAGSPGFRYTRTVDGGATFDPVVDLANPAHYSNAFTSLVVGGDDAVHALWIERTMALPSPEYFVYHRRLLP